MLNQDDCGGHSETSLGPVRKGVPILALTNRWATSARLCHRAVSRSRAPNPSAAIPPFVRRPNSCQLPKRASQPCCHRCHPHHPPRGLRRGGEDASSQDHVGRVGSLPPNPGFSSLAALVQPRRCSPRRRPLACRRAGIDQTRISRRPVPEWRASAAHRLRGRLVSCPCHEPGCCIFWSTAVDHGAKVEATFNGNGSACVPALWKLHLSVRCLSRPLRSHQHRRLSERSQNPSHPPPKSHLGESISRGHEHTVHLNRQAKITVRGRMRQSRLRTPRQSCSLITLDRKTTNSTPCLHCLRFVS